jgi:hypothetical protein
MYHVDIGHLYDLDDRLCYLLMTESIDGQRLPLKPLPLSKVDVGELTERFNINTIITELRSRGYEAHADTGKRLDRTVTWCISVVSKECSFDVVIDYSELNRIFIVKADLTGFYLETITRDSLGDSCIEMSYTMNTFSKLDTFYKYFLENNGTKKEEFRCIKNRIPCDKPIPTLHRPIKQFATAVGDHLWKYYKFHNDDKPKDYCYSEDSLYLNNLKLDRLSACVFDFLAYFGYQDKIYMKLNPVHRHLVGCLVKFHAIDIRKKKLRSCGGGNREFLVGPFDLTYYMDLIKPSAGNSLPNEPCVKLSIDSRLCSQIDGMISVSLSSGSTAFRIQTVSEAVKEISLQHVLSKLPGFSGYDVSGTHDLLLNYSMVFVFSKLIGQSYNEANHGTDKKEIALSFIIRNLLTKSSMYIEEFVKYFESGSERGSIWTLFKS